MTLRDVEEFHIDRLYSNEEIMRGLGVGNAGGVRVNVSKEGVTRRVVIMTSLPSVRQADENPYHDRIEGDILVYTGAGLEGDQSLGGVNKRLPQQNDLNFPMYCFQLVASRRSRSAGPKRWKFFGLLEYLRHYPETQIDARGTLRKVWTFEFKLHRKTDVVCPETDYVLSEQLLSSSRFDNPESEDEELIADPIPTPGDESEHDPHELEKIRKSLLAKSPEQFEHFISRLLSSTGYERVSVTKFSQDGGIDVVAHVGRSMWAIENLLIQVQAKRWLHTVGRKEVAELRGSLEPQARGTLITTSHYSKAAIIEAGSPGKSPIVLVDGYSLAGIVKSANLSSPLVKA